MENNQERIQETLKRSQTVRHDHLFKVVILGDAKVGKTSLVAAFTGDSFSEFILLIFTFCPIPFLEYSLIYPS